MSNVERWREPTSKLPSAEELKSKGKEGWRLSAIEWERAEPARMGTDQRPIPYALRISSDCQHLEIDPTERDVVSLIIAMIAADHPLSRIAAELNRREFRNRGGAAWTQVQIFQLLPRVIELGPEILSEREWSDSKRRVLAAVS